MSSTSWTFETEHARHSVSGEVMNNYRARLASEERERLERKNLEREELRSDSRAPDARIRAWERLHGLRLPAGANHPVVQVIVSDTRLTLADVVTEQQARAARAAPRQAVSASCVAPESP